LSDRRGSIPIAIATLVLALALLVRAPGPEDWDGIGFLSSITRFDLAAFSPHPPGYPVYVVLLRAVAAVVRDATFAGALLSALAVALCAHCTFRILEPRVGIFGAAVGALAGAAPSLLLRSGSQVGTEATALAFLVGAVFFGLRETRRAAITLGVLVALGVGVRLSWWPLFLGVLALAPKPARIPALLASIVAGLSWSAPLALVVGPRALVTLLTAHGEGHAQRFGRTLLHDGDVVGHAAALARDLTADGLGIDATPLGLAIAVVAVIGAARFVTLWANGVLVPRTSIVLSLLAYALFVFLFQNVIESPRHLVPIVYACSVAAGVALARSWSSPVLTRATPVAFVVLLLLRGTSDARARTTEPPLGAQIVALATRDGGTNAAIFGGDSARFAIAAGVAGGYAENLGDVTLALGGMQHLPATVFVTSEVHIDARLPRVATVCRPPRLDRKHRCLDVYELR
jgi:hypothetical protein